MALTEEERKKRKRESDKKWRENNREKKRESDKQYHANNREKKVEYLKQWYANNPEKVRANRAKWKANNPEKVRECSLKGSRRYNANNREKRCEYAHRRATTISAQAWEIIGCDCMWRDLGGCEGSMHRDHIIPPKRRHKTGYTSAGLPLARWILAHPAEAKQRLQPLCQRHNCFKGDLPNDEAWAKWAAKYH